jgi:hypothetical protein
VWNLTLQYGPDFAGPVVQVPSYTLTAQTFLSNINQFVSESNVYTVPLTNFDLTKVGLSKLYPYTFSFDSINFNNPQTFFPPNSIVGVQIGAEVLIYGQDYYAEFNNDANNTYTVYFYNDPGQNPIPAALVWYNGGQFTEITSYQSNSEIAFGTPIDDFVVNVDTQLYLNYNNNTWSAFNDMWDLYDPVINSIVTSLTPANQPVGFGNSLWDQNTLQYAYESPLGNTISFKENLSVNNGASFYRNGATLAGTLLADLPSPILADDNIQTVLVFASPGVLPIPNPNNSQAIWINGERIEYKRIIQISSSIWQLSWIRRGTMGTSATTHPAMIPSQIPPYNLVPNSIWIESGNIMAIGANSDVWSVIDNTPIDFPITLPNYNGNWSVLTSSNGILTFLSSITGVGIVSGAMVQTISGTYPITYINGNGSEVIVAYSGPSTAVGTIILITGVTNADTYTNVTSAPLGGLWYSQTTEAIYLKQDQGISIP